MMTTRRILIFAPVLLILLLLQSYFWVPTYEEQTRGNPERFNEYITASIGDASILNPILSADASSSEIESKVFEGLIDYDENLDVVFIDVGNIDVDIQDYGYTDSIDDISWAPADGGGD